MLLSTRINSSSNNRAAFTLVEMLVVIAIIGVLAALILSALSAAKARATRTVCLNNLKQINLAVHSYADDNADILPASTNLATTAHPYVSFTSYQLLLGKYVGLSSTAPSQAKLFACPADRFYYDAPHGNDIICVNQSFHEQPVSDYTSYWYNGARANPNFLTGGNFRGVVGTKLSSIKNPSRTILVAEYPAYVPYSWHETQRLPIGANGISANGLNNAKNILSFADGHASYLKIYWDTSQPSTGSYGYNPPVGYDYQWTSD